MNSRLHAPAMQIGIGGVRPAAVLTIAVCALALAGCGAKKDKDKPASQTAAKVNKEEITVHQINFVLAQQRGVPPEQAASASKQVLERLVDQELALQKAQDQKLDRDPRVVQQLEAARREVIARAYAEKIAAGAPKPSSAEIKTYYDAHPALFKQRRVYNLQELAIQSPPEKLPELQTRLTEAKDLGEFVNYLKTGDIKFNAAQAVRSAEQLPLRDGRSVREDEGRPDDLHPHAHRRAGRDRRGGTRPADRRDARRAGDRAIPVERAQAQGRRGRHQGDARFGQNRIRGRLRQGGIERGGLAAAGRFRSAVAAHLDRPCAACRLDAERCIADRSGTDQHRPRFLASRQDAREGHQGIQVMRIVFSFLIAAFALCASAFAQTGPSASASVAGAPARSETVLGVGDSLKITVFQNPDLTVDAARISENGQINFPLIGNVALSGLTVSAAEQKIAKSLRDGGFVLRPQVTITVGTIRSSLISILGQVGKPGRYPIEQVGTKVSEMIAAAGGVVSGGADVITLVGTRNGRPVKLDIDMPAILQSGKAELDITVENGDIVYVDRAPTAYIYGEVQRPGMFKLERGMTLMQALAQSGGLTARGTQRGMKVHRRDAAGAVTVSDIGLNDPVVRDDVIYVKESLF